MSDLDAVHVVGAAILERNRCLVAQRGPQMSLPGKWEFPGGKIERGERPAAALVRELEEELGLNAQVGDWLARGESLHGSRRVVLDVFSATAASPEFHLREHRQARWIGPEELYSLDWAGADVPVIPAVQARMNPTANSARCVGNPVVLSADWGKQPKKRAVYVACNQGSWRIARQAAPVGGWTLHALFALARRFREEHGVTVLIGIDAVLGVPVAFARSVGIPDFIDTLRWLSSSGGLQKESEDPSTWRPERPFFRVPSGRGGLSGFVDAAGGRSAVFRQMDLRTGAKPIFALSGIPGTVGSGSRELWLELASLLEAPERDFSLWPFEGTLEALTAAGKLVLAELYPRAAYAVALEASLPAKLRPLSKTVETARAEALFELERSAWIRGHGVELSDVDSAMANEDDFDALMTAAALVRLVEEDRPMSHELVDPTAEGGILATGGVELAEPVGRPLRRRSGQRRAGLRAFHCPIAGCDKVFSSGRLGWDAHVGSRSRHPNWHPQLHDPGRRKELFREEFRSWFLRPAE